MSSNGARKGIHLSTMNHRVHSLTTYLAPPSSAAAATKLNYFGRPHLLPPDVYDYDAILSSEDKKPVKWSIKSKYEAPSQTEPGNWQDSKSSKSKPKHPAGKGSLVNPIDPKIAAAFPSGKPFEETPDMVQCKHCKKPVYKSAAPSHIKDCLKKKQEKLQKKKVAKEQKEAAERKKRNGGVSPAPSVEEGSNSKTLGSARKSAKDTDMDGVSKKTSKKRKADDDGKGPSAKKKKKDEPKPKTAKPKGPVDVEKQCGVLLPNGSMCARSLTCKSHSMGAKRAVPGRSMPYDVLLAQYQKKNQAKMQSKYPLTC
jgi:SAGA-associated factor 73